jgi:hypothetical protein
MAEKVDSIVPVGIAGLGRAGWGIHANVLDLVKDKYRSLQCATVIRHAWERRATGLVAEPTPKPGS